MRILGISGSLQAKSGNLSLLRAAARATPADVEFVLFDGLRHLPQFDPDLDVDPTPSAVRALREALAASDGLLIASPEYGHSLPGALKNAIDWAIPSGELEGRPVAITCSVAIAERGLLGLQALRQTLNAVSARIVGGQPIVKGARFEQDVAALLHALIAEARTERAAPAIT
jgi:chromate reductase